MINFLTSLQNFTLLTFVCLLALSCSSPQKQTQSSVGLPENGIAIRDAWVRPVKKGMMGAAYFTIANGSDQPDTLLRVSTNAASSAEVHETFEEGNDMTGMRPAGKLSISPHSTLALKPGGYHLMLIQANRDFAVGDSLEATLFFSRSDSIMVNIPVSMTGK